MALPAHFRHAENFAKRVPKNAEYVAWDGVQAKALLDALLSASPPPTACTVGLAHGDRGGACPSQHDVARAAR